MSYEPNVKKRTTQAVGVETDPEAFLEEYNKRKVVLKESIDKEL